MKNACEINLVYFFNVERQNIGFVKTYIVLTRSLSEGTWIVANGVICVSQFFFFSPPFLGGWGP